MLTALLLVALPPTLQPDFGGGFTLGVRGGAPPLWRLYRKFEVDAGLTDGGAPVPVDFEIDGGFIVAHHVMAGCSVGCTYVQPGLLVAAQPSRVSSSVAVRLESAPNAFEARMGFVEAGADGGMSCPGLTVDNAVTTDPFWGGWGCDGLVAHVLVTPPQIYLVSVNFIAAGSTLFQSLRTDYSTPGVISDAGFPLSLRWRFEESDAGYVLVIDTETGPARLPLPAAAFAGAPNPDGVSYEGATLDPARFWPIGYFAWANVEPGVESELTFSLSGISLDLGQDSGTVLHLAAVDETGRLVLRDDPLLVYDETAAADLGTPRLSFGRADLPVAIQGVHHLKVKSALDATIFGELDFHNDAPDAGTSTDAGVRDAGMSTDAGTPPVLTTRALRVGCGCSSGAADPVLLLALLAVALRAAARTGTTGS